MPWAWTLGVTSQASSEGCGICQEWCLEPHEQPLWQPLFLWTLVIYTNPEHMLRKRSLSIAKFRNKKQNSCCCTSLIHQQQESRKLRVLFPNVYFYINMALIRVSTSKSKGLYLLRILWNHLALKTGAFHQKSQSHKASFTSLGGSCLKTNCVEMHCSSGDGRAQYIYSMRLSNFSTNTVLFMGLKVFPASPNSLYLAQSFPYAI